MTDLGSLGTELTRLANEAQSLRADVARDAQSRKKGQVMLGASIFVVLVLVTVLGVLLIQGQRTNDAIEDCTTPGGGCYQRGQAQTGRAIGQLISAQEAIAECSKSTASAAELRSCVAAKLASPVPPSPKAR